MRGYNLSSRAAIAILIVIILLAVFPLLSDYYAELAIIFAITLIATISFRLIVTMGRWSFAHVPIMGFGGYTSAILASRFGLSFWLTLPIGAMSSAFIGLLISYPTLRTRGFYYFMSTYAAGAAIVWCFNTFTFPFGGTSGIYGVPRPASLRILGLLTLDFDYRLSYGYLVLSVALLCLLMMYRIERSRLGRILKAIASEHSLAKSVGINTLVYETIGFVIGCFFAGVAGVLFVHNNRLAHPEDFGFLPAVYIIIYTVVGGTGRFTGPIVGALTLLLVNEALRGYNELVPLFYGFTIIATILVLPMGLVDLPAKLVPLMRKTLHLCKNAL